MIKKPKLYLETTIPSYLTALPSRDVIVAGHQQVTFQWWEKRRNDFSLYISQFVIDEASKGDGQAAERRLSILEDLPLLAPESEVELLAEEFIRRKAVPKKYVIDAAHIAISAVNEMDFLLTWNCTHIANAEKQKEINIICKDFDYECPVICTPEELLGGK